MADGYARQSKPLVLVVEDEAALATMLRYNLEKKGFRVTEAGDGPEALTCIAETPPDLVLLDWMLPALSGLEVCRQIRRRPATRDLPVIMLTARVEEQDAVRGLDSGADDYVTKPFGMDALFARMRALLRRAGAVGVKGQIAFHDIELDLSTHRATRNGRRAPPRTDGVPPAGVLHAPPAPRVRSRGCARRGVGRRYPCGAAHR